jgi:hypothetical protein
VAILGFGFASQTQGIIDVGIHAFEITAKAVSLLSPYPGWAFFSAMAALNGRQEAFLNFFQALTKKIGTYIILK